MFVISKERCFMCVCESDFITKVHRTSLDLSINDAISRDFSVTIGTERIIIYDIAKRTHIYGELYRK